MPNMHIVLHHSVVSGNVKKPHLIKMAYNYGPHTNRRTIDGVLVEYNFDIAYEFWKYFLRHFMVETFGPPGKGNSKRWVQQANGLLNFNFRDAADVTLFALIFSGRTTTDFLDQYVDYPHSNLWPGM